MLPFYSKKNDDNGASDDMEHGGSSDTSRRRRRPFYVSIYRIIVGYSKALIKKIQRKKVNSIYVFVGLLIFVSLTIVISSNTSGANYETNPHPRINEVQKEYYNKFTNTNPTAPLPNKDTPLPKDDLITEKKGTDNDEDIINNEDDDLPPIIINEDADDDDDDDEGNNDVKNDVIDKNTDTEKKFASKKIFADNEAQERQAAVKAAMKFAWDGYVKYAWGSDELKPSSKRPHNWLNMGASITDSLDTLWIMGFKDEFYRARDWVRDHFNPTPDTSLSFFETTIRSLGGLLSAYALSEDQAFLDKAVPLANGLMKAIDESSGIPYAFVNPKTGARNNQGWTGGRSILAEVGTVQLEFAYLSHVTGDPSYRKKTFRIMDIVYEKNKGKGVLPAFIDTRSGVATSGACTLGALADSYYEYLMKLWVFLGGKLGGSKEAAKFREMYDEFMDDAMKNYVFESTPSGLVYITDRTNGRYSHRFEHLTCFTGGMLALGAAYQNTSDSPNHDSQRQFNAGKGVTKTCHEIYARMATKLSPEAVQFANGNDFSPSVSYNILRPEAVESFFILWRLTHDPIYREYGWNVFQAFESVSKTEAGYSGIKDVAEGEPRIDDNQPSWFLAETLKYLYLLFSPDDVVPLDQYVFSTEAHPLPIIGK